MILARTTWSAYAEPNHPVGSLVVQIPDRWRTIPSKAGRSDQAYMVGYPAALPVGHFLAPGAETVIDDLGRRLRDAHPGCTPLAARDGPAYRDATIVEGVVTRGTGSPI